MPVNAFFEAYAIVPDGERLEWMEDESDYLMEEVRLRPYNFSVPGGRAEGPDGRTMADRRPTLPHGNITTRVERTTQLGIRIVACGYLNKEDAGVGFAPANLSGHAKTNFGLR